MTTLLPSSADCLEILEASTYWSPKSLYRPVQDKIYLLAIKSCKKSLVLSKVKYAPSNGSKLDISKEFWRKEMVKVVTGEPLIMHKAGNTAKTMFPVINPYRTNVENRVSS